MIKAINIFLKPALLSFILISSPFLLTSCSTVLPSTNYQNLLQLTESQSMFAVNAKSLNSKGLLADGPNTQSITLNVSKKKNDKNLPIVNDNLKWGLIVIELPSYYGPKTFVRIEEKRELVQFQNSIQKFIDWSKLPYSQRESTKASINTYLKNYGMGESERARFGNENTWYVMNDNNTQEPLLILHKDYKKSTIPSNTIGFTAEDLKNLSNKVVTVFDTFDDLNTRL